MAAYKSHEPSSPSSSTLRRRRRYDLYLSTGEDTRKNFADHLFTGLEAAGINVFIRENSGEELLEVIDIQAEILEAMENSRISVIVISKHYAAFRWCLVELAQIMELRETLQQLVFPIFYNVDPSDVRRQRGIFEEPFRKHEEHFDVGTISRWRMALTKLANLRGFICKDSHEGKLVAKIVEEIQELLHGGANGGAKRPRGGANGGANGRTIGKLFVSNKEIAKGSNGTIVFEGIYSGRPVAVKRLVKFHHDVALREIEHLIASDQHPNIVRWHGVEGDQDFVYLALERCTCSLGDLIQIYSDSSQNIMFSQEETSRSMIEYRFWLDSVKDMMGDINLWKENRNPSPLLLQLMRDVVSGLVHLHELGIIHRDLKPQNVLIIKEKSLRAKLSDMGISKRLLPDMSSLGRQATGCGSSGWQAPEKLLRGRQTRALDLFSLGCVLFFCITGGRHPFGDHLERDINIVKNQVDLLLVEHIPEAVYLFSHLLEPSPELRPKAVEVLHHPLFWSSEMRLSFLRDTSDRVELEDRKTNSGLLTALENTAPMTLGGEWNKKMEPALIADLGRYRRYNFNSVRDVLRVMRNKLNHYGELRKEIKEILGPVPEGFDGYFASRFPKLLIEVYKVVRQHCREEECFQKYLKGNV